MTVAPRTLAVIALTLAAMRPACAQDEGKPAPKEDAPATAPADDAASVLDRLGQLYARVLQEPPEDAVAKAADPAARADATKRRLAWRKDVDEMNKAADAYVRALGGAAPDLTGLYYRGFAKAVAVDHVPAADIGPTCDAAADALGRYLDAAEEKSAYRGDAERRLAYVLLRAGKVDDALPHATRAVELLQKESRRDEAGKIASLTLATLSAQKRDEDLRKFADAIGAADADFGRSTPAVRGHAAAAKFTVGAPLPELPALKDVEGKAVSWRPGKSMLLHFFLSGHIDGRPTGFREIEIELRPLWDKVHEKGIVFVGVSTDLQLPADLVEKKRKQNEEWGVKTEVRDGSLASVREWASQQGIAWPWCWDGKGGGLKGPVTSVLGGIAMSEPYAVLVDKDGIVRWRGAAPFKDLPEAVAKLIP